MFKKYLALVSILALFLASTALAEAPTSQFGFKGWPYRQPTNCETDATQAPATTTKAPEAGENLPDSTLPTAAPATQAPVIPTSAPTKAPEATQKPTVTQAPSTEDDYTTQSASAQEQMMLKLLNQDRNNNGLPSLTLDPTLSNIARIKSCDMRDNNYFAHESPTYGRVKDMLNRFGYSFSGAGENIAHHATVEKAEAAFMSSSGHRQNILSSAWTKVGIGICFDRNGYVYVTQIFVR
ncbi:MAG: serine protease [Christensenellaceae bacterium]|nr:serine protease [Christensenellaceae bacterium]